MAVTIENTALRKILPHENVRTLKTGFILSVTHNAKPSYKLRGFKRLSKDEYMIRETGEVKTYNHAENKAQSKDSVRRTMKNIRNLINNNFVGADNEVMITLTYKENMTDVERLYYDMLKFWKRLKYQHQNMNMDYIAVVEPQARGAWHVHMLVKRNDGFKFYVPNDRLADCWGNGFVKIRRLNDVTNVGAYVSVYLTDLEMKQGQNCKYGQVITRVLEGDKEKRFIKGGRLYLYPAGMNIVRHSAGIKIPVPKDMRYSEVKKIVGAATPHYSKSIDVNDEKGNNLTTVTYMQYNMKRSNSSIRDTQPSNLISEYVSNNEKTG
jgi:hypothetical protein